VIATAAPVPLIEDRPPPPKRALILAGGGLKVAYQAGVLQVWLDEARDGHGRPLEFMHADGASGGTFNLAMWCQGMSGRRIADNWRRFSPLGRGFGIDRRGLARSLFSMERFRRNVLREDWALDWHAIRATTRSASFNVYDFTRHRLVTLSPPEMSEDLLVAAGSLPVWYPPVRAQGTTWIDGVFATDANLEAAIERGADELWVVWTVDRSGIIRPGPVNQYFAVIEACANGRLNQALDRIDENNTLVAQGRLAESRYGRTITVRRLDADVDLAYLVNFRGIPFVDAVEAGVRRAREWCRDEGFGLREDVVLPDRLAVPAPAPPVRRLRFAERMSGPVATGCSDPVVAAQLGDARGDTLTLRLRVEIGDLDRFLGGTDRLARVLGSVDCDLLGGARPVIDGSLELLPDLGPGAGSVMRYRLDLRDVTGRRLRLIGTKTVFDDPGFDLWSDTTTLAVRVVPGWDDGPAATVAERTVLAGQVRITLPGLVRQLTTFRTSERTLAGTAGALGRFGTFFARRLVDVYLPRAHDPAHDPAHEGAHDGAHDGVPR
jgi:predicted acylesterase/phospholipase RssA